VKFATMFQLSASCLVGVCLLGAQAPLLAQHRYRRART
jgi:hypothetical protein